MADQAKIDKMQEIVNRGLLTKLPAEKQKIVQEALNRGMINQPSSSESYTLGEAVVEGWKNFLPSIAETVEEIGTAVVGDPIGAVTQLAKAANGILEKPFPEFMQDPEQAQAAEQAIEQILGKWGLTEKTGYEDFKRNLAENPGPMALDLSVALEGGGSILAQLPKMAKAGQAVSTAGRMVNPANLVMETAKAPMRAVPKEVTEAAGRKMVEKQMKPSTTLRPKDRIDILNYAAEGGPEGIAGGATTGIPVNPTGLKRVKKRIDTINNRFNEVIESAAKRGESVSVDAMIKQLERTRDNIRANPYFNKLVGQVDEAAEMMRTHPMVKNGKIPIDDARAIKTEIYRTIDGAYGEISSVSDEVLKDLAHGVNKQIYEVYPELKALGQEQRTLISLNRELERAVNRLGNNNAISLQDIGAVGAIGAAGGGGALAGGAGIFTKIMRMPNIRSAVAKALNKANKIPLKDRVKGKIPTAVSRGYVASEAQQSRDNYVEK